MAPFGLGIICRHCQTTFWMCRTCYRGHRYCSVGCREVGYQARRRAARRKNEALPHGRQNHRDRQQELRDRRKNPNSQLLSLPIVPDKASGSNENPLKPTQNMQPISTQRQPAAIFRVAVATCSRCGREIVRIYGGSNEFFRKRRQPRDE